MDPRAPGGPGGPLLPTGPAGPVGPVGPVAPVGPFGPGNTTTTKYEFKHRLISFRCLVFPASLASVLLLLRPPRC